MANTINFVNAYMFNLMKLISLYTAVLWFTLCKGVDKYG